MGTVPVVARGMSSLSLVLRARQRLTRQTPEVLGKLAQGAAFYEMIWASAAHNVGVSVSHMGAGILEIDAGGERIRISSNTTSLDDPVTVQLAGDKPMVHRLLTEQGIPVPQHLVCSAGDLRAAWAFAARVGRPLVVKPARSTSGGNGVTVGVTRRRDIVRAMAFAGAFCGEVVIEELVAGDNYRLLYLDGELLDAVLRLPPQVEGDGTSSLDRLIQEENRARLRDGMQASRALIDVDWELKSTLREQGYSLRSVPQGGRHVRLKRVVNDNRGADNEDARDRLCGSMIETGAAAARAVGARFAGVDIMTPDGSLPLREARGAVIEVNTTPGLYYHYVRRSRPVPVAERVLQRLVARGDALRAGSLPASASLTAIARRPKVA